MAAAPAAVAKGGAVPDWANACDLSVCDVLQEMSAQIVTNCRSFSAELQGVCTQAKAKLPSTEPACGNDSFDCAEACFAFLENFGDFSRALLQLAGDLETVVSQPLQKTIATMTEERIGRTKHWQMVAKRFAERQDRYCRSRQKSLEARKEMASKSRWNILPKSDAASEQLEAVKELAQCEEEMLRSEASLRELEAQSRERFRQLESEKRQLLQGALMTGSGLLKRLLPSSEKALNTGEAAVSDSWVGVLPHNGADERQQATERLQASAEADAASRLLQASAEADEASAAQEAEKAAEEASSDPAAKYVQGAGGIIDFGSEESEGEAADAAVRAVGWSPQARAGAPAPRKQRSLVFQSPGHSLVIQSRAQGSSAVKPAESAAAPKAADPPLAHSPAASSPLGSPAMGSPAAMGSPMGSPAVVASPAASPAVARQSSAHGRRLEEDSSDEEQPLELLAAEEALEITPMVAENPQRCFEEYVARVPGALVAATETSWEALQAKGAEQVLGGHLGKLEFFWLHEPGSEAAPRAAAGLVCFQFVQGAACNFGRVLHLSVAEGGGAGWKPRLASAIREVRRHLFAMLPIDSLRAVVLACQDGAGPIYVDSDVEAAYQRCRFRWFQLTQNIKRRKGNLVRQASVKLHSRFLVLHAMRGPEDPRPPRSDIGRLPALLFRRGGEAAAEEAGGGDGFTSW